MNYLYYMNRQARITVASVVVPADLDTAGFDAGVSIPRDDGFREDRINAARQVIRRCLKKMHTGYPRTGSNWVRSVVEESLGYFLLPGELIVAMIGEGFAFERKERECTFNVDPASFRNLKAKP